MNGAELAQYSATIATEYYKNNAKPFLDAFSENCLWLGPAEGQMIRGKEALLDGFAGENHQLTFAVQDMQVIPIPVDAASLDVILRYTVITYYPNGDSVVFQQRCELLWTRESVKQSSGVVKKQPRIRVCHISNEYPYDARDRIYPNHFNELDIAKLYTGRPNLNRFFLKGPSGTLLNLSGESIQWIASSGTHTMIHTANEVYESLAHIATVTEKYADTLCHIHVGFSVNPMHVKEIGRFYVIMDDGTRISIPQRKYTATKAELIRRMEQR